MRKRTDSQTKTKESGIAVVKRRKIRWSIWLSVIFLYAIICVVAGILLYDTWYGGIWLLFLFPLYLRMKKAEWKKEEEFERSAEFLDALTSIGACLEAGYSMENAIRSAEKDLDAMYAEEAWIREELRKIVRAAENSMPVEEALMRFARESGVEDAVSFAEVYATAKSSGGNLLVLIHSAISVMSDKNDVKREIWTILSAKQVECRIMQLMVPGILVYFRVFSGDFIHVLYEGMFGKIFMTGMFGIYVFLMQLMRRITKIEL